MATKKTLDQVVGVDYLDILQQCEKVAKVQSINLSVEQRLSTGLLCLDGILGGGITAGMYTFFGPEQSAKTTAAVTLMGASVGQEVGQCILWDAENSTGSSMDYVSNIFKTLNVKANAETIFGVKKDGKWLVKPLVYYRDEGEAETFFNFVAALLRRLPDKRYEDGNWWYIYPRTKENISGLKDIADATKSRQNDAIYVKAESGSLQAIIVVDSYPGLMPASMDEDDPSGAIAQKARAMSSGIDRVKGRLRSKRVALVGINQLRMNPMDKYNPEYEPAGQALKYFCFAGSTLLNTDKGLLTAEEYYFQPTKKLLGESGLERPTVFDKQGYSQLLTLHTARGHTMSGKPDHHVRVLSPLSMETSFRSLLSLKELCKGRPYIAIKVGGAPKKEFSARLDFISTLASSKFYPEGPSASLVLPSSITPDLSWILGVLVGDGHVRNGMVTLSVSKKGVAEHYTKLMWDVFKLVPHRNNRSLDVHSVLLMEFLTYLGAGSKSSWQKTVPWSVRMSGRSCWLAFLAGLFDSDFSAAKATISYSAASATLVDQVRVMTLGLGYPNCNGNLQDTWWAHGANSRLEFNREELTEAQVAKKHQTRYPSLVWYGDSARDLLAELRPFISNVKRYERFDEVTRETHRRSPAWRTLPIQEFTETTRHKGNDVRRALKLYTEVTNKSSNNIDCWDDSWLPSAYAKAQELRTEHERNKVTRGLDKVAAIIKFSKDNQIFWDAPKYVTCSKERSMTYDGNMPVTHTIVTSGIVSHNSDCRLRFMPLALSGVPFHPKGAMGKNGYADSRVEEEKSVDGEGVDRYRYIRVRSIKNKLSLPNRETWLRIWIEDSNGNAQGYDPVWDTFYALFLTGQVTGKRSAITLCPHGREPFKKTLNWNQFKQLIIGTKEQKAETWQYLGSSKVVDLRTYVRKQLLSEKYETLYIEWRNSSAKALED